MQLRSWERLMTGQFSCWLVDFGFLINNLRFFTVICIVCCSLMSLFNENIWTSCMGMLLEVSYCIATLLSGVHLWCIMFVSSQSHYLWLIDTTYTVFTLQHCTLSPLNCILFVAVHSHYDLSAEGVFAKHRAAVKREAEKYAKAALQKPSAEKEIPEQIAILTKTFNKCSIASLLLCSNVYNPQLILPYIIIFHLHVLLLVWCE